jgi:hypothetical protein
MSDEAGVEQGRKQPPSTGSALDTIVDLRLRLSTAEQSNAVLVAALRGLSSAAENFKAYAEGEYGVGRGSADEDDHNITDLDATIEAADAALAGHTAGVVVPEQPTEAQWGGLARDIMMWLDMHGGSEKTPRALFTHLERIGREIPQWLRDEPEMKNLDHVPSKGTRCAIIYKAMLRALLGEGAKP